MPRQRLPLPGICCCRGLRSCTGSIAELAGPSLTTPDLFFAFCMVTAAFEEFRARRRRNRPWVAACTYGSGPACSAERGDVAAFEGSARYEKTHVAAAEQRAAYRARIRGPHEHQDEHPIAKAVYQAAPVGGSERGFEAVARHDACELLGLPGARHRHIAADCGDVPEGWLYGKIAGELAQRGMNRTIDFACPGERRPDRAHDGDPFIPQMQGQ